ncbi:hypothetical protein ACZ87_01212, partial [Candidatus Erwinia dacicola]
MFLTGKLFFRHTNPAQASATIAFSPFHATFLIVMLSPAFLPQRRQNAVGPC